MKTQNPSVFILIDASSYTCTSDPKYVVGSHWLDGLLLYLRGWRPKCFALPLPILYIIFTNQFQTLTKRPHVSVLVLVYLSILFLKFFLVDSVHKSVVVDHCSFSFPGSSFLAFVILYSGVTLHFYAVKFPSKLFDSWFLTDLNLQFVNLSRSSSPSRLLEEIFCFLLQPNSRLSSALKTHRHLPWCFAIVADFL